MEEPDEDKDLCDFNEHKLSNLERRIHNLEHSKAVSEIVINKKGKKLPDKKTTAEEIEDLHKIDIGLYPLIESEWALGKGGLKALQYMATGIPTIATDFGTVQDFMIHQKNGFLVVTIEQWVNAIKTIAKSPKLRKSIIMNARDTVENNYSVSCNKNKYLNIFEELSKGSN